MKRGNLCWVNLEPATPPEFGKLRPCLIVSNSEQNEALSTVVIVPVSSKAPEIWPLRLGFKMPGGKLSFAVLPGIRQVNKNRLQETIGPVPPSLITQLDEALLAYLGG